MTSSLNSAAFFLSEPRLTGLVDMCKQDLKAVQVWIFGSRARGDNTPESDWDVLAVVSDDTPDQTISALNVWNVAEKSKIMTDLVTVKKSDFDRAQHSVTTLSYEAAHEGIRIYG